MIESIMSGLNLRCLQGDSGYHKRTEEEIASVVMKFRIHFKIEDGNVCSLLTLELR